MRAVRRYAVDPTEQICLGVNEERNAVGIPLPLSIVKAFVALGLTTKHLRNLDLFALQQVYAKQAFSK